MVYFQCWIEKLGNETECLKILLVFFFVLRIVIILFIFKKAYLPGDCIQN